MVLPCGYVLEVDIMKRPICAVVLAAGLALATVAAPSQAQAQWRGWGWGLGGFAIGALAGAAIASSTWGYPGYYGYGYPAYGYGYGYPAYGYGYSYPAYGYGYGYAPAAYSYGYPAYYGGYSRPYYGAYAYAGRPVVRRAVIHRARWR
jgi:hypothetical protein